MSQTLLISGFFLSYVLPMIPFMIFGMQVIGWLATTAEGMFAVCFAVSLLTNSDGDGAINTGFLKALSLTAAIFLKPFFIVVGVALANAIAAPAFAFYNEQFWLAWDMDNAIGGNVSNVLFEMSAQLILYIVGAAILVKFVYSIQHIVPDSMNNWISGGIVNPFGVQGVADNVQADLKTNAGSMTSAGVGAASAVAKKRNES
jgi:conjugal transfer/type IV secretion protein DotA/TraY